MSGNSKNLELMGVCGLENAEVVWVPSLAIGNSSPLVWCFAFWCHSLLYFLFLTFFKSSTVGFFEYLLVITFLLSLKNKSGKSQLVL